MPATYRVTTTLAVPESRLAFIDNGSLIDVRAYLPGPHTGSLSGQWSDTPRHTDEDIERNDDTEMLADSDFVLSITNWTGKPVTDGV